MRTSRVIALLILVLGLLACFGHAGFSAKAASAKPAKVQSKSAKAKTAAKSIKLTANQKAKMKQIKADAKTKVDAVKADSSLTADAKKAKIKQIRADALAQMKQVLTAKQLKALQKQKKVGQLKKLDKELGLTAQQKTQVKSILQAAKAEVKAVRGDSGLTPAAKKAKFKEIHAATQAKIRQVLTPEQQRKLDTAKRHKKAK